jgi:hypothetical protein
MGNTLIKTRYTIRIPSPDSAVMRSEVSIEGGPMTLLMELKGTRVKQSSSNFDSQKLVAQWRRARCYIVKTARKRALPSATR